MKIRAIKGSGFESVISDLYEKVNFDLTEAKQMVEDYCGSYPINIGYLWAFGKTAKFTCNSIEFDDSVVVDINKLVLNKLINGKLTWQPNRRYKIGRDFEWKWNERFLGITGVELSKYGIDVFDEKTGCYFNWIPAKDDFGYYILIGSHILDKMKTSINKNNQYTIDYD